MDASQYRGSDDACTPDRRSPPIAMEEETPAAAHDGEDLLSALPDDVLRVVLSFLTSLQAARTTTLSWRWRYLWHAVPCIDIDEREFFRPPPPPPSPAHPVATWIPEWENSEEEEEEEEERRVAPAPPVVSSWWDRFVDAANWLTHRHGWSPPPLEALRLRVTCGGFHAAGAWIRLGLVRRPAAFHLRVDNDADDEDMDWGWPFFFFPAGASTRRLTTLRLSGLSLTSHFADSVAADFPVLDDMELHDCRCEFTRLTSASLTHLSIEYRRHAYTANKLVLFTPNILSLRILGDAPPVKLDHEVPALFYVAEAALAHRAGDRGVLRHLRYARTLRLYRFSTAALLDDGEPGGFPLFRNLRNLLLDGCDVGAECHVLRRFLKNAPFLEMLTVRNCLRNCAFSGGGAPVYSKSRKRKERAKRKRSESEDQPAPTGYPCWYLKLVELEFSEDTALFELSSALQDITKEVVHPIEGSVQDGRRTVKIKYT